MKFNKFITNPITNITLVVFCALICLLSSGSESQGSHNFEGLFAILVFLFLSSTTLGLYLLSYLITKKKSLVFMFAW
jgi:hypothetical protein